MQAGFIGIRIAYALGMTNIRYTAMLCNSDQPGKVPGQITRGLITCAVLAAVAGCGWVDSAGPLTDEQAIRLENLSGDNDVVTIASEEQLRLDTSALLSRGRNLRNEQLQSRLSWQLIGSSDISACPHFRSRPDTGVSLQHACDSSVYGNARADCSIYFVQLPLNPAVFEVSVPAVTSPVVLRYQVTSTFSNGSAAASDLTICLEP